MNNSKDVKIIEEEKEVHSSKDRTFDDFRKQLLERMRNANIDDDVFVGILENI